MLETLKHLSAPALMKRAEARHRALEECGFPGEGATGKELGANADSINRSLRLIERDQTLLDRKILRRQAHGDGARVSKLRAAYLMPSRLQTVRHAPEYEWKRIDGGSGEFKRVLKKGGEADSEIVRLIKLDSNARFYLSRLRATKARLEKVGYADYSRFDRAKQVIRDRTVRAGWWIKNNRALGTTTMVAAGVLLKIAIAVFLVREVFGKHPDGTPVRKNDLRGGPGDTLGQFPFENLMTQPGAAAPIGVPGFGQLNVTV